MSAPVHVKLVHARQDAVLALLVVKGGGREPHAGARRGVAGGRSADKLHLPGADAHPYEDEEFRT